MSTTQYVYAFNELELVQALPQMKDWEDVRSLLGGKGSNLFEMIRLGFPVPPGFTFTTEACNAFVQTGAFPSGMWEQGLSAITELEKVTEKKFGDTINPLMVSCRSGAKFSMPGMMDTVLNIGLNDNTAGGLIELTKNPRFVFDSYRRLVQMFGTVVMDVPAELFEHEIETMKHKRKVKLDVDLTAEDWEQIVKQFKRVIRLHTHSEFPKDPYLQLEMATQAVFNSWFSKRAVDYRNATGIPHDLGTAVNIQMVVFGNMGETSATGVAFTRNPVDGTKQLYGDYLINAQGEDVVAGIRNTTPIAQLQHEMPDAYGRLRDICDTLERHFTDMQDIEFTIERGKLWMLQTRNGKRAPRAAVKIAVDMVNENFIEPETALMRVTPEQVEMLLHPQFTEDGKHAAWKADNRLVPKAVNASPGAAVGMVVFDANTAEQWGKEGKHVIMVRPETKPDDVHGMIKAQGILTSRGGATSHAAVVARQFGIPAVCGAEALQINVEQRMFTVQLSDRTVEVREGDWLSIDGSTGEVFLGQLETREPNFDHETDLKTLLSWADDARRLGVWANADYPEDAERARRYGAEGVGLCRTEHMFFQKDRLPTMQKMILSSSHDQRAKALAQLMPMQRDDFVGIFRAMHGNPVIIRLLDPPLHEFLPQDTPSISRLARRMKVPVKDLRQQIDSMKETNPMLGLRGDRLGIMMPEITEMQVRAILEAAILVQRDGVEVHPKIMIPLACHVNELTHLNRIVKHVAGLVFEEQDICVDYQFGTMIEVPRAALTADEMAQEAEFFSCGTNDLTQMTLGISRDDAELKFLIQYVEQGILPNNPFQQLDRNGVGKLIEMSLKLGRDTRPDLKVGVCGEHGGDPKSIEFCHLVGVDYVSCSPFRVPVARLAAAQAAIKNA